MSNNNWPKAFQNEILPPQCISINNPCWIQIRKPIRFAIFIWYMGQAWHSAIYFDTALCSVVMVPAQLWTPNLELCVKFWIRSLTNFIITDTNVWSYAFEIGYAQKEIRTTKGLLFKKSTTNGVIRVPTIN